MKDTLKPVIDGATGVMGVEGAQHIAPQNTFVTILSLLLQIMITGVTLARLIVPLLKRKSNDNTSDSLQPAKVRRTK